MQKKITLVLLKYMAAPDKQPKPTLESIAALRGGDSGSAAWLKR